MIYSGWLLMTLSVCYVFNLPDVKIYFMYCSIKAIMQVVQAVEHLDSHWLGLIFFFKTEFGSVVVLGV